MTLAVTPRSITPQKSQLEAFNNGGLSYRILTWLYFGASLKQVGWQKRVASLDTSKPVLSQWLNAGAVGRRVRAQSFVIMMLAVLLGVSTMVGGLSYSGDAPVNLWLILSLFAFLPLLLTLSSTISALRLSALHPPFFIEMLARLIHRIVTNVDAPALLISSAGRLWLFRQLQWFGAVFQITLIATFMLMLLFNDIAFGWSSTLITQTQWLPTFFNGMTWPWHTLVDAPTEMLIVQSQFYRVGSSATVVENPALLGQWWPHIAMAMLVYGLIPRCLLLAWLSYRAKVVLQQEITCSGDTERFFQVFNNIDTIQPKFPPIVSNDKVMDEDIQSVLMLTNEWVVGWQRAFSSPPCTVLGLKKWQDDEGWLKLNVEHWGGITYFLVQEMQVPTAELADVFMLVNDMNPSVSIHLVVMVSTGEESQSERSIYQRHSWRYFAAEHNKDILFVYSIERQSSYNDDASQ